MSLKAPHTLAHYCKTKLVSDLIFLHAYSLTSRAKHLYTADILGLADVDEVLLVAIRRLSVHEIFRNCTLSRDQFSKGMNDEI